MQHATTKQSLNIFRLLYPVAFLQYNKMDRNNAGYNFSANSRYSALASYSDNATSYNHPHLIEGEMIKPQVGQHYPSEFGQFAMHRPMIYPRHLSASFPNTSLSSNQEEESDSAKKAKKSSRAPKTEWTKEQAEFLLRLWADNYHYINSAHSRKAWKKVCEDFNKNFGLERKPDLLKRKVRLSFVFLYMFYPICFENFR